MPDSAASDSELEETPKTPPWEAVTCTVPVAVKVWHEFPLTWLTETVTV